MKAYLQGPDGEEYEFVVTEPDPADGTFVVHLLPLAEALFEDDVRATLKARPKSEVVGNDVDELTGIDVAQDIGQLAWSEFVIRIVPNE